MINSPHWHPQIVTEKWKLLEYFYSVPDDNSELMDPTKNVASPVVTVLCLRLGILWLKYKELTPQVRKQLEYEAGRLGWQEDGPRYVSFGDGFRVEEGRGRIGAVPYVVYRPGSHRSQDED